ncbi:MAG: helix-turn-helix transcriptional regulator [Clostridia bacterium]|nr:helix-turn-helix transcriptional regulator [Clostridia bacterium]
MDCLARIRELLVERGMSMYQLSKKAGIPQSTLSNLFIRYNAPTIPTLEKICEALGITMSEFFKRDEDDNGNDEKKLISEYHKLSQESRLQLIALLESINKK